VGTALSPTLEGFEFAAFFVEFVEDVVVELPTSIDVVQKRLGEVFRWVKSILVTVVHL
jgi:hypothetical protein